MSVYKRPGRAVYSYDFVHRGNRFSGSTGCKTKREAEKFEDELKRKLKTQVADRSAPMTFMTASTLYWEERAQHFAKSVDIERYLAWLQKNIGATRLISSIDDAEVARLVAKRRGEGNFSNASINRGVTEPLRAILRRARRTWKQTVQDIDWKQHLLKEPQERIREASADEEKKLLEAIRGDYAPALRFALLSGCRRAEIVGLRWRDVDFFNKQITIFGKGEKTRVIPMTRSLYDLLKPELGKHPESVFTYVAKMPRKDAGKVRPITMEGFKTEWRRTVRRAGVSDYRFHDNRHTAATRLVRATGNLRLAQRLLGHSDLSTTTRYAHVTHDDLRAGMEAATPTKSPTTATEGEDKDLKNKGNVV